MIKNNTRMADLKVEDVEGASINKWYKVQFRTPNSGVEQRRRSSLDVS